MVFHDFKAMDILQKGLFKLLIRLTPQLPICLLALQDLCPKELSAMQKIFYICTIQYNSHYPHEATQSLKGS